MPGRVDGMNSREPSSSGGMNSEPSFRYAGTVAATTTTADAITSHFHRSDHAQTASYGRIMMRQMGWVSSEWIFPTSTALAARASHRGRNSKFFM